MLRLVSDRPRFDDRSAALLSGALRWSAEVFCGGFCFSEGISARWVASRIGPAESGSRGPGCFGLIGGLGIGMDAPRLVGCARCRRDFIAADSGVGVFARGWSASVTAATTPRATQRAAAAFRGGARSRES